MEGSYIFDNDYWPFFPKMSRGYGPEHACCRIRVHGLIMGMKALPCVIVVNYAHRRSPDAKFADVCCAYIAILRKPLRAIFLTSTKRSWYSGMVENIHEKNFVGYLSPR